MKIERITVRAVLDSHASWTPEFDVELEGGVSGRGSSPRGETLSVSESAATTSTSPTRVREQLAAIPLIGTVQDQRELDELLESRFDVLGRSNALGLSLAYLDACSNAEGLPRWIAMRRLAGLDEGLPPVLPRLLVNVLNGGRHAYTNPVLSDFHEYLLAPRSAHMEDVVDGYHAIQKEVAESLGGCERVAVGDLWVHSVGPADNRSPIEFLIGVLERLGLRSEFGLVIDAAAGDLVSDGSYRFSLTSGEVLTSDEFVGYWASLIDDYGIQMLEDPFGEDDTNAWAALASAAPGTTLVGDDYTEADPLRIEIAASKGTVGGVMIKPNKAGTVTRAIDATTAARDAGILVIPSHRSIETDGTWLADFCLAFDAPYAKLGLLSGFETIVKVNHLLRADVVQAPRSAE